MTSEIAKTEYFKVGKMTVICLITLNNGQEVAAVATKPRLNEIQEEEVMGIAYQRAMYKLAELESFSQNPTPNVGWTPTITL